MNTEGMNYDIKYISPVGTVVETHAEVTITMAIKERADAQKFILELSRNGKMVVELKNLLEIFDERREHFGKAEMEVLLDEIAKEVWNKK